MVMVRTKKIKRCYLVVVMMPTTWGLQAGAVDQRRVEDVQVQQDLVHRVDLGRGHGGRLLALGVPPWPEATAQLLARDARDEREQLRVELAHGGGAADARREACAELGVLAAEAGGGHGDEEVDQFALELQEGAPGPWRCGVASAAAVAVLPPRRLGECPLDVFRRAALPASGLPKAPCRSRQRRGHGRAVDAVTTARRRRRRRRRCGGSVTLHRGDEQR